MLGYGGAGLSREAEAEKLAGPVKLSLKRTISTHRQRARRDAKGGCTDKQASGLFLPRAAVLRFALWPFASRRGCAA